MSAPARARPARPAPRPADVRLVAIDLDGTACLPGGALGPRCGTVLRALHDRGVAVVFATGRSVVSTRRLQSALGFRAPAITLNGSLVDAGDGDLWHHRPLDRATTAAVRAVLDGAALTVVHVLEDTLFCAPHEAWAGESLVVWELQGGPATAFPSEVTMFFAIGEEPRTRAAAASLRERFPRDVSLFEYPRMDGARHHVEVRAAGDDKGAGLRLVRERLGIPREATLAVGDWLNDVPLLEEAGYGVAMAHAPAALRAVADVVTRTSNHAEGAAEFLAGFFAL